MICVILQLIVDLIWTTHRKFFWKHFTFWHKMYSTNICYDIFAASEIFNFIWNIFNSKALKACYIITIHMQSHLMICTHEGLLHNFFFSIRVLFTDTDDSHDSRGSKGTIFYSILPFLPAHENWDIYLRIFMWHDYHVFLTATVVFTRLLLNLIYYLIKLPFEWLMDDAMFVCLLDELILGFCYSDLTLETGGFELASTVTLVLQSTQLTKCASHPICSILNFR